MHPRFLPPAVERALGAAVTTLCLLPAVALADQCWSPESHFSPGDVDAFEPPAPVDPACSLTFYRAEDDMRGLESVAPEDLILLVDGVPITLAIEQQADRTEDQPFGCWEYEAPMDAETIARRWQVWTLTPDEPLPEGAAEVRVGERVYARFDVVAGAGGCADSEPPPLGICSPGVDVCNPSEPDAGEAEEMGVEPDIQADMQPDMQPDQADAGPEDAPAARQPDEGGGGCAVDDAAPPWPMLGLALLLACRRRRDDPR